MALLVIASQKCIRASWLLDSVFEGVRPLCDVQVWKKPVWCGRSVPLCTVITTRYFDLFGFVSSIAYGTPAPDKIYLLTLYLYTVTTRSADN